MCLVSAIKVAYKQALQTGRIYEQQWTPHDPMPNHLSGLELPPHMDFSDTVQPLNEQRWSEFQARERAFRKAWIPNIVTQNATSFHREILEVGSDS